MEIYRVIFIDGEKVIAEYAYILMTMIDKFKLKIICIVKHFMKFLSKAFPHQMLIILSERLKILFS